MSERMSTRRERKQTEKAEANSEAAAPAKERAEAAKERRHSAGPASTQSAAATSTGPGKPAPEAKQPAAVKQESKQQAAPKQEAKQEAKQVAEKVAPIVKAPCHTPAPRAKRLKTDRDDEPRASSIALAPTLPMQLVAGTGVGDFMDGPVATSCLRGPMGLAVDAQGNVIVADADNRRIRMICRRLTSAPGGQPAPAPTMAAAAPGAPGAPTAAAPGSGAATAAPAAAPASAPAAPAGPAAPAAPATAVPRSSSRGPGDEANGAAGPLDFERVRTLAGCGNAGCRDGDGIVASFADPCGIAVATKGDRAGAVYVSDAGNHTIRRVSRSTAPGQEGKWEVAQIAGVAGRAGHADGVGKEAQFNYPYGLSIGPDGTLYVADSGNQRIRAVNVETGEVRTVAGNGTPGHRDGPGHSAQFFYPTDVAVDGSDGTIFVCDRANHRVRKVTSKGNVSTLAGSGLNGVIDAKGAAASFSWPNSITLDPAPRGALYVTDTFTLRIRRVQRDGTVRTIAIGATPKPKPEPEPEPEPEKKPVIKAEEAPAAAAPAAAPAATPAAAPEAAPAATDGSTPVVKTEEGAAPAPAAPAADAAPAPDGAPPPAAATATGAPAAAASGEDKDVVMAEAAPEAAPADAAAAAPAADAPAAAPTLAPAAAGAPTPASAAPVAPTATPATPATPVVAAAATTAAGAPGPPIPAAAAAPSAAVVAPSSAAAVAAPAAASAVVAPAAAPSAQAAAPAKAEEPAESSRVSTLASLTVGPGGSCLYVAEQSNNRVTRVVLL